MPTSSLKNLTVTNETGTMSGTLAPAKHNFRRQRFSTRQKQSSSSATAFQHNPYQRNANFNNSASPVQRVSSQKRPLANRVSISRNIEERKAKKTLAAIQDTLR